MTLYLYRVGTEEIVLTVENAVSYTADEVRTADGKIYAPLADDCELSSKVDCSETLRAQWRAAHPDEEARIAELEELLALLLFGGEDE